MPDIAGLLYALYYFNICARIFQGSAYRSPSEVSPLALSFLPCMQDPLLLHCAPQVLHALSDRQ